jgi:hypothetical protein
VLLMPLTDIVMLLQPMIAPSCEESPSRFSADGLATDRRQELPVVSNETKMPSKECARSCAGFSPRIASRVEPSGRGKFCRNSPAWQNLPGSSGAGEARFSDRSRRIR